MLAVQAGVDTASDQLPLQLSIWGHYNRYPRSSQHGRHHEHQALPSASRQHGNQRGLLRSCQPHSLFLLWRSELGMVIPRNCPESFQNQLALPCLRVRLRETQDLGPLQRCQLSYVRYTLPLQSRL